MYGKTRNGRDQAMARLLKGSDVAAALTAELCRKVEALKARGILPALSIIRVGERKDDIAYERGAVKRCNDVGVRVKRLALPQEISQAELLTAIAGINADSSIHGVLLFRPLPPHLDENIIRNALHPDKDVDGLTDGSLAGVVAGTLTGFPPCTPVACLEVLTHYGIDVQGKNIVVVGASLVVGKPVSMVLLNHNATVTICHDKTQDVPALCRAADILIIAVGHAGLVDERYLSPGQIVLDVGINLDSSGKLCGDVNFSQAERIVEAITPVPGGIGTVTASVLAKHVVEAAARSAA